MCFLRDGDRLLLLRRRNPPNAGLWNGVGGKVEPEEDPYTACIREVAEETGLSIGAPHLRALLVVTVRATGALWVIFVFTDVVSTSTLIASDEGELAWVKPSELTALSTPPDLATVLPHLFRDGGVLVARVEYETETSASYKYFQVLGS